jgi:hypothetical protein
MKPKKINNEINDAAAYYAITGGEIVYHSVDTAGRKETTYVYVLNSEYCGKEIFPYDVYRFNSRREAQEFIQHKVLDETL